MESKCALSRALYSTEAQHGLSFVIVRMVIPVTIRSHQMPDHAFPATFRRSGHNIPFSNCLVMVSFMVDMDADGWWQPGRQGGSDAGSSCRGNRAGDPSGPCRVHPGTRSKAPSVWSPNQPANRIIACSLCMQRERETWISLLYLFPPATSQESLLLLSQGQQHILLICAVHHLARKHSRPLLPAQAE